MSLIKKCAAEGVGTALLLATVVGSGIMAERLSQGNAALALFANSIATGLGLGVYILVFHPLSGAHFNPLVTLTSAVSRSLSWAEVPVYVVAQFVGAFAGVAAAHLMFGESVFVASTTARSGLGLCIAEAVAAFGLLSVVVGVSRRRPTATAAAVGAYIAAGYWFTSSTSFANPAVTLARAFTNTFTGISLADVPGFIAAQSIGALLAVLLFRWFYEEEHSEVP